MARTAEPAEIVRELAATLERIEAVGLQLSAKHLVTAPEPGAWSPNELLWHIRATADVHGEHVRRILNEDEPRWTHVSPRARMKKVRYYELQFAESLAAFAAQRKALLELLKDLPAGAWERLAIVKVPYQPDRPWRPSVLGVAWGMAAHEAGHCLQMEEVAARLAGES